MLLKVMSLSLLLIATNAFAEGKANTSPDAQAVDAACAAEGKTAGCGDAQVGTGLLKCIHAYKKEHRKEFKVSDGCKTAMKTMHEDRKAKREKK